MPDRRLCRLCCGSYSRLAVYSFHLDMEYSVMKTFDVSVDGKTFTSIGADSETDAREYFSQLMGYDSEADFRNCSDDRIIVIETTERVIL